MCIKLGSLLLLLAIPASVPASVKRAAIEGRAFPVNALPPLTYSPKKYTFYIEDATFMEAWQLCRSKNKRLATIENLQDHMAYTTALSSIAELANVDIWIAGTNLGAKADEYDKYYWITNDRPVGNLNEFVNWIDGIAPSIPSVCMATYFGSANWIYGICTTPKPAYACEESQDV